MKTNKQLAQLYQITNKQQNLTDFIYSIYNRTLSMFAYTGLPDTVDRTILEKHLQLYGYVVFFKYNNKLYFTKAGLTGNEKSPYNEPTEALVNVPALGINQRLTLNKNAVLVQNDDLRTGLLQYIKKSGTLLIENEITMLLNSYNDRIQSLITAGSDQSIAAANQYLNNIINGNLGTIAENSFLQDITVHNAQSTGKIDFSDLIQYQQYLKSDLYNMLGLSSLNNMKKERMNSLEVQANDDNVYPFVDSMLSNRKQGFEMVNKLFNGNIQVDFNGAWKDKAENRTNSNANQVDEPVKQPEPKEPNEPERTQDEPERTQPEPEKPEKPEKKEEQ